MGQVVATLAPSPMRVTPRIWLVRRATLGLRRQVEARDAANAYALSAMTAMDSSMAMSAIDQPMTFPPAGRDCGARARQNAPVFGVRRSASRPGPNAVH